jgi:hypothetical protein
VDVSSKRAIELLRLKHRRLPLAGSISYLSALIALLYRVESSYVDLLYTGSHGGDLCCLFVLDGSAKWTTKISVHIEGCAIVSETFNLALQMANFPNDNTAHY